jgi:hypothetical protein
MASCVNTKFVSDIVSWNLLHPRNCVKIGFRRETNGMRCFTCIPPPHSGYRTLFISCTELLNVFEVLRKWKSRKYWCSSVINMEGTVISIISGDEPTSLKRLTLKFTFYNNTISIDLGIWWRSDVSCFFKPSPIGFQISGRENIDAFIEMGEEIIRRLNYVNILENLFEIAHELLYIVFEENIAFDAYSIPNVNTLDIDKFSYLWKKEMERCKNLELRISARDIYNYITSRGFYILKDYIDSMRCLIYPMRELKI